MRFRSGYWFLGTQIYTLSKCNPKTSAKAVRAVALKTLLYSLGSLLIFCFLLIFVPLSALIFFAPVLLYVSYLEAKREVVTRIDQDKYQCATQIVLGLLKRNVFDCADGHRVGWDDWRERVLSCWQEQSEANSFDRLSEWDFEELIGQVYSDSVRAGD